MAVLASAIVCDSVTGTTASVNGSTVRASIGKRKSAPPSFSFKGNKIVHLVVRTDRDPLEASKCYN